MNKNILILKTQSGDWEGLFIGATLVYEGHHLGEGDVLFMLKMSEKFNFKSSDVKISVVNDIDESYLEDHGNFPESLIDLNGNY